MLEVKGLSFDGFLVPFRAAPPVGWYDIPLGVRAVESQQQRGWQRTAEGCLAHGRKLDSPFHVVMWGNWRYFVLRGKANAFVVSGGGGDGLAHLAPRGRVRGRAPRKFRVRDDSCTVVEGGASLHEFCTFAEMAGGRNFGAVSCYASWTRILSEHRLTPVPFSSAEDRLLLAAVAWCLAVLAVVWFLLTSHIIYACPAIQGAAFDGCSDRQGPCFFSS